MDDMSSISEVMPTFQTPPPVPTPVAKKKKAIKADPQSQLTLTQGGWLERMDQTDDDLLGREITTDVTNSVTPSSKKRKVNTDKFEDYIYVAYHPKNKAYRDKKDYPQPGDLVTATAGHLEHPGCKEGVVNDSHIMIGTVEKYCYKNKEGKDSGEEYCLVNWEETEVYMSKSMTVKIEAEIPPTLPYFFTILGKKIRKSSLG